MHHLQTMAYEPRREFASTLDGVATDAAEHFRALGYDRDRFYFVTARGRQIIGAPSRALSDPATLMSLAPLPFWRKNFASQHGIDANRAVDHLINVGFDAGVYDPRRIRGRGAWWDNGRAVLNLGDRLVVDGKPAELTEIDRRFLYEAAAPLRYTSAEPLSDRDAEAFLEVCDMLRWEQPVSGILLAGWCVVASICGAMRWRPHIWITSKAGSGKSWVMDNIIRRAVGELSVVVQSRTTEAGLRQAIEGDARPVLFDEAEGEDQRSRDRMQAVIEYARAGSSEGGAEIIKGTTSGHVKRYRAAS